MRAAAVHPLLAVPCVVVGERKVRRPVAQRLANGDALGIERIGDAAGDGLGALLVDVPALEMLERRRIHDDQRRVNDGAGVHQRSGQHIAAPLDGAGEDAVQQRDGIAFAAGGEYAGRQPLGADGDRRLEGAMLARKPRQRAGLGEDRVGVVAGVALRHGEQHRAEGARRHEHHLVAGEMRRQHAGDVGLGRRRRRAHDELGPLHRLADVGGDQAQARLMPAPEILDGDDAAGCAMRLDGLAIATPQPHVVAGKREITGRRQRAISTAQYGDPHSLPAPFRLPPLRPATRSLSLKCCTLPMALRGRLSTITYSRGTL